MEAGRLDRFITIQRKVVTQDDAGETIETWSTIALAKPASWGPIVGDERFNAPQFLATEQVEFRIRYSPEVADLSPQDRIIYPALASASDVPETRRIYDILDPSEIGRREGIKIKCARRPDVLPL